MKPKAALLLVVLAIIVGVGGWYLGGGAGAPEQSMGDGKPAFPGLVERLQAATQVEISQGGKALTLNRSGDAWGIAQKGGYPVKPDKLHALLAGLADVRLLEPRTSNPDEYALLGVGDPPKDKEALLIRVLAGTQPVAALIVGHQRTLANPAAADVANQLYVRQPDQAQSWLAQGKIEASTDAATWTGEDLTDIKADRMASVTVTHGGATKGGATLEFAAKNGALELVQPAEHPPLDASKVKDVAQAFEYLIFMDVGKAADQPGTVMGDSIFHTKDGLTLTAHVTKAGDKVWAHFSAQGTGKSVDEAKKLSGLFDGWAYQIGDWKLSALAPTLDELKAPPPKETPKPAAAAAAAPAPAPAVATTPAPAAASAAPAAASPAQAVPAKAPAPETAH